MILKYGADDMKSDKEGFTLIELMIAIAIFGILSVAVIRVYTGFTRSYTTQEVAAGVQQSLRAAIDIMAQDIWMAGLDTNPSDGVTFGITDATPSRIRFTSDRDQSTTLDTSQFEEITYAWTGNTLNQILDETIGGANTQPLVNNVTALTFTYFDENNNPTAILNDIRSVGITMNIQEAAGREGLVTRSLSTRVRCRNIDFK
jgi:type II secretion system protein J